MHKASFTRTGCVALAIIAVLVVGCGSDSNTPTAPGIQPQIINSVDNFQFQVTAVDNHTGTLTYWWPNTGAQANINQSCSIASGTVTLTLLDGSGTQVYSQALSQNGTFASVPGASGTWRVSVIMSGATGDLNFRLDKSTP
ncbi:MAG TPA: hypothetical protein VFH88_14800 [Candidatus Krumholzibacteria bacterium]|nr:hypothetical protein [Candidatus Krumholzibacteria bacterium]